MRISQKDLLEIKRIFAEEIIFNYELRLFGSRADDCKLGGDIDLLLIVSPENLEQCRNLKYRILDRLQEKIGEQKIDLVIVTHALMREDPFLISINNSVTLLP